jgi:hypothetical protein
MHNEIIDPITMSTASDETPLNDVQGASHYVPPLHNEKPYRAAYGGEPVDDPLINDPLTVNTDRISDTAWYQCCRNCCCILPPQFYVFIVGCVWGIGTVIIVAVVGTPDQQTTALFTGLIDGFFVVCGVFLAIVICDGRDERDRLSLISFANANLAMGGLLDITILITDTACMRLVIGAIYGVELVGVIIWPLWDCCIIPCRNSARARCC